MRILPFIWGPKQRVIARELNQYGCSYGGEVIARKEAQRLHEIMMTICRRDSTIHVHADRYRGDPDFRTVMTRIVECLAVSPALRAIQYILGDDVAGIPSISLFRRVSHVTHFVPWHQDARFVLGGARVINCWIPLADVGDRAAGLEVVRLRLSEPLPLNPREDVPYGAHYIGESPQEILGRDPPRLGPHLRAGRVFLFDQFALHRTQPMVDQERVSLEVRLIAADRLSALGEEPLFSITQNGRITLPLAS